MTKLRSVLFDLDDTLFSTSAFAQRARGNAVRAMIETGLDVPEEIVLRELQEVIAEFSSNYAHHFDKLVHRLRPGGTPGINPALIVAAGVVAYHDTKFRGLEPYPDVKPLLEWLSERGVQTGVITHGWTSKQAEKIVRLGLLRSLDPAAIFISDQIGISKPNPKLYAQVLRELDRQPNEVIYVGDNPAHDIAPPQSIGITAIWAKRGAKHRAGSIVPNYVVENFGELRRILVESFDLPG